VYLLTGYLLFLVVVVAAVVTAAVGAVVLFVVVRVLMECLPSFLFLPGSQPREQTENFATRLQHHHPPPTTHIRTLTPAHTHVV